LFGLGAGGTEGVERVLESEFPFFCGCSRARCSMEFMRRDHVLGVGRVCLLIVTAVLKAETETCMRLLGVDGVEQLGLQHVSLTHSRPNPFAHVLTSPDQRTSGRERHLRRTISVGLTKPHRAPAGEAVDLCNSCDSTCLTATCDDDEW
jgi:hypothetical protein